METPITLAKQLSQAFTNGERVSSDTGRPVRVLLDGSPDWMTDVIHAAHSDMMPDDFRYQMIEEVIVNIADLDDDADVNDATIPDADIYTAGLTRWLASHVTRVAYCDEALEERGGTNDTVTLLQMGQEAEYREIHSLVCAALVEAAEQMGWEG